jgi:predicted nucleic acid-binding Zn ribbon protein
MAKTYGRDEWDRVPRRQQEQALEGVLKQMMNKGVYADKIREIEIIKFYEMVVGKPVARMTKNVFVRKGKLYIKVESPALKQELVYSREKLLTLVNERLEDKNKDAVFIMNPLTEVILL